MLDARRLRTELGELEAGLARKGVDPAEVDNAADLDARWRLATSEAERLRADVKALSKQVGQTRRNDPSAAEALMGESRKVDEQARQRKAEADELEAVLRDALLRLPNVPSPDAPDGAGPEDNVVVRVHGFDPDAYTEAQRVPHWESGPALGLLDLERGAKLSGAMFPLYRGAGARLIRALTGFALARHSDAFEEIRPPTLVRSDTLVATGQLPKFADDAYHIERDDLWAIPTAEVPLTSLARDEVLDEADLPMRLTAATACYRRESGAAGRDTRGTLRSHEFDKVEILAYCTPAQAPDVHAELLARAEGLLTELELPYRVVDICTGDLGQSHARQFDLDVYSPGVDAWLEVSSVSWFTDYQARRANIRYRRADDRRIEHVHTLNGSALAWSRIWPALVETGRRADGSIVLPRALHPFFGDEFLVRP
jgi:seryl-tRNA synthetase